MKNKLPDCQLVEILQKKSDARNDIDFDYIARLEELRHRIGAEVRFINELFPEYTPHDEEYHLTRLFHVADTIIEPERYENMNASELFVLACGLYGHDWGMAVSAAEKNYIISGVVPEGLSPADFALLHDEHKAFERFVSDRGLTIQEVRSEGIPVEDWREYVRKTHAFRSGSRMRHYFRNIDSGAGDAAGRVCEGHWLNIDDLENFRIYPMNFAVLRENLNLAALAVYVRLVDLLDIGHDRTPYVIWKFVAPRDRYSKLEWEKHRALQPITCPAYLKGRVILVDGSTDDHEVYAALEDLHNYCEKQIRECMNLLAQAADPRHFLDLYHLDWRVIARGFDPVLIRFEFDRDRVFDILSDEIYQGDPYVFLRELLQNSVDAIRMRRELLERAGIIASNYGSISVDVQHGTNGDARITWTDDGVGMDSHIVRNYLAVAGRSYYRSEEFQKQGLSLDPISKFGIGILSCFMVADLVEIETCRDPYAKPKGGALRIKIPAVTRQFRVEQSSSLDFGIGTRVVVHVEGRRLREGVGSLDVTRYLKVIAGFIEFPILISENGVKTVILHPHSKIDPASDIRIRPYSPVEVHKLKLKYPFDDAFLPQDLEYAKALLKEEVFDVASDLALTTFEGAISYLVADDLDWLETYWGEGSVEGILLETNGKQSRIRWTRPWSDRQVSTPQTFSRSAEPADTYSIYKNGILISGARIPNEYDRLTYNQKWPVSRLVLNISGSETSKPDIARVELRSSDEHWFSPIERAMHLNLRTKLSDLLSGLEDLESLLKLGLFSLIYRTPRSFFNQIDESELPLAVLSKSGEIHATRWKALSGKRAILSPSILEIEVRDLLNAVYRGKQYTGFLKRWHSADALILNSYISEMRLERALAISRLILENEYYPAEVVFLTPPDADLPPIVQEIWHRKNQGVTRSLESIAAEVMVEPLSVSPYDLATFIQQARPTYNERFIPFPIYEQTPFCVGSSLYNLRHPVVHETLKSLAFLLLNKHETANVNIGRLSDSVRELLDYVGIGASRRLSAATASMFSYASKVGLELDPSVSFEISNTALWYQSGDQFYEACRTSDQPFGQPLTEMTE